MKPTRPRFSPRVLAVAAAALAAGGLWLLCRKAPHLPGPAPAGPVSPSSARPLAPPEAVELVPTREAGDLHADGQNEARDVAALRGLLGHLLSSLRLAERPPLGDNADITAALLGWNRRRIAFLAPDHPALRGGLLVDRRGVPYHFHARSADAIDVRSAGADRVLFTEDDLVSSALGERGGAR